MDKEELLEASKRLHEYLEVKDTQSIKTFFDFYTDVDLAELLSDFDPIEIIRIFRLIPPRISANIFSYLDTDLQESIVEVMTKEELPVLTAKLSIDDFTDITEHLPSNLQKKILAATTKERRETINALLNYDSDTAGAIMTVEYVEVKQRFTCQEALDYIKKTGSNAETITIAYVVDETRKLIGSVPFRDLFFASKDEPITDYIQYDPVCVYVSDDREIVADIVKKHDLPVIPVVNDEDKMMGIITHDDVIDVIVKEATEDIQRMEGISPLDKPYLETSVLTMYRKRIVWLLVLMISAIFTGGILSYFEDALAVIPTLAIFIPMLMDTGGNSAGQSSTLVIRSLSLKELGLKDWWKIIYREFLIGSLAGLTLAVACFIRLLATDLIKYGNLNNFVFSNPSFQANLAACITLIFVVILAKVIGGILPLIAKFFKVDPAVTTGPFVTTIIDALALIVYFLLAVLICAGI